MTDRNNQIKNVRKCVEFYGTLRKNLEEMEARRHWIQKSLEERKVIWQDPMTILTRVGMEKLLATVRRELDRSKIALHDLGPDQVHQCTEHQRGFSILKVGEQCDRCGYVQPEVV